MRLLRRGRHGHDLASTPSHRRLPCPARVLTLACAGLIGTDARSAQPCCALKAFQNRFICLLVPMLTRRDPSIRALPAIERTRMPSCAGSLTAGGLGWAKSGGSCRRRCVAHLVLVELVHKPCLGLENLFDVVIDVRLVLQRRHACDHREAVDVVGAGDPADAIHTAADPTAMPRRSPAMPAVLESERNTTKLGVALKSACGRTLSPVKAHRAHPPPPACWVRRPPAGRSPQPLAGCLWGCWGCRAAAGAG